MTGVEQHQDVPEQAAVEQAGAGWVKWGPYATNGHRTYRRDGSGRWVLIAPVFARITGPGTAARVVITGLGTDGAETEPVEQAPVDRWRFFGRIIGGSGIDVRALITAMDSSRTAQAELCRAWRMLSRTIDAQQQIGEAA